MRETRVSIVNTLIHGGQFAGNLRRARELGIERIEYVGRDRPDIILFSEIFANCEGDGISVQDAAEPVPGPITEEFAPLARKYQTYIALGMYRRDEEQRIFNSLVLLDRNGEVVWIYDKVYLTVGGFESCTPGVIPQSYMCDFGRVAGAICFDINFLELADLYSRQGVELVLFSSAFPAGRLMDMWAVRYGFNIAGSTWYDRNRIIDCTGATVARTSDIIPYTTAVLNLNRCVLHMDGNLGKLDEIRTKYAGDVLIEDMRDEALCVLTSLKKGLEVHDLIRDYGVEKLYDYLNRAREMRSSSGGLGSLLI
jgi:predicted amidohydrolase